MANQPIPIPQANAMIQAYSAYMSALNVDMKQQTTSVSFTGAELMAWLGEVMPYSDELRIFMGEYPKGTEHEGRTTVILWPYKGGKPAIKPGNGGVGGGGDGFPPYNMGSLNP